MAPDKFKGSLTAVEAAAAVADGLRRGCPGVDVVAMPIADGGEGTVDAAVAAGYTRHTVTVAGPTGEPVRASFATRGVEAVLEMAEASGLRRLPDGVPAPLRASTTGTGELLAAALDTGASHLVLAVGGSASTDGGAGMAQALGARLLDADGRELPPGGAALARLERVDLAHLDERLAEVTVVLASDVDNPLTGPDGAAAVYGPQKGASAGDVEILDAALARFATVIERETGVRGAERPGAGAAGGTGYGAMVFFGAQFRAGVDVLMDVLGFAEALAGADLVITGEGSLDAQSLSGKAPVGVARAAAAAGVPVVALAGRVAVGADQLAAVGIGAAHALLDLEPDVERAMRNAGALLARLAERVGAGLAPART